MNPLIQAINLSKEIRSRSLFSALSFSVLERDRLAIIGPNGAGKSTLLQFLLKKETPDTGSVVFRSGTRMAELPQEVTLPPLNAFDYLVSQSLENDSDVAALEAEILLEEAEFLPKNVLGCNLSGGQKKLLALLGCAMRKPDLYILDEPTNHLDLHTRDWLEEWILKTRSTFITVSHDRQFLERVATKVLEIHPTFPQGSFFSRAHFWAILKHVVFFLKAKKIALTIAQ
jgi:ATPase components of ABC transporters with duplicated ATPase domains